MNEVDSVPTAAQLMNRRVQTVTSEMSLMEATRFLLKHQISNAPVVQGPETDGHPLLLGFVSEQDCLEHLSNEIFFGRPVAPHTVETIMRRHPVCVSPADDAFALSSIFVSHGYRHLPVVEDGRLLGIVSRRDILRSLEIFYHHWQQQQDRENFPPDWRELINLRFLFGGH
ncbi:MAG: CBS domain-containing protein [Planctomycetaceae bacterium]|nr:CBS domain-containing protein [Planctomycetaceae bacterium]